MTAALLALLLQQPSLDDLLEKLRSAETPERRDELQEELRRRLRADKPMRAEAGRRLEKESDAEVRARVRWALDRCPWIESAPEGLDRGHESAFVAAGAAAILWGGGRFVPEKKAWAYVNEARLLDPATGTWTKIDAPPIEWRRGFESRFAGGRAVLRGGSRGFRGSYTLGPDGQAPPGSFEEIRDFDDGVLWDGKRWEKMAPGPVPLDPGAIELWVGDTFFTWGGAKDRGGATWDAKRNEWTKLPDAPIAARSGAETLVVGDRVWIRRGRSWPDGMGRGKRGVPRSDGAIFDLEKREWKKLPDCPHDAEDHALVVAHGGRVIVWGGASMGERVWKPRTTGAIYDLAKERWTAVGAAPLEPGFDFAHAIAGGRLWLWGGYCSNTPFMAGASLDLERGTWEKMPDPPLETRSQPNTAWVGGRLVVWGGHRPGDPAEAKPFRDGAAFDTATGRWTKFEAKDLPAQTADVVAISGGTLFAWVSSAVEYREVEPGEFHPVDAAVNRGLLWRDGAARVVDGRGVVKGRASALWVGGRLALWSPEAGTAYVYEPGE
jgi:hypothetical protein